MARRGKGRRRKQTKADNMVMTRQIFPLRMTRKFVWCKSIFLTQQEGDVYYHRFRLNSLMNPDYEVLNPPIGNPRNALGFDALMPYYDHYYVTGAKITVDFTPQTNQPGGQTVGIAIRDTNTQDIGNDVDTIKENPNGVYINSVGGWGAYAEQKTSRLVYKCSIAKFLGIGKGKAKDVLNNKDLSGTRTTNPAEDVGCFVWTYLFHEEANQPPKPVNAHVRIEFIATLTEPKQIEQE